MAKDLHIELLKKRRELAEVERELQSLLRAELLSLPQRVGAASIDELIELLAPLASAETQLRVKPQAQREQRRKRATVTAAMRARVVELLASAHLTAKEIALEVGVSPSFVNKLKAAKGMTRSPAPHRK